MAKLTFDEAQKSARMVRQYFTGDESVGKFDKKEKAREGLAFAVEKLNRLRYGYSDGDIEIQPQANVSFEDVCQGEFGATKSQLLVMAGINFDQDTFTSAARKLGFDGSFNVKMLENELVQYNHAKGRIGFDGGSSLGYDGAIHTTGQYKQFRWLIPELFLQAIEERYLHEAKYPNWIAANFPSTVDTNITVPKMEDSDARFKRLEQGEDIPLGVIKVGQKSVETELYGVGFEISDTLLNSTPINLLVMTVTLSNSAMNIGEDSRAIDKLINGDGVGLGAFNLGVVNTTNGYQIEDIDYMVAKTQFGMQTPNVLIANPLDIIKDLNSALPDRERLTLKSYFNEVTGGESYSWGVTQGQSLMFNKERALFRVQVGGMFVEQDRMARKLSNGIYFSFRSGFYTGVDSARLIMDNTVVRGAGGLNDFPEYADFEAWIARNAHLTY